MKKKITTAGIGIIFFIGMALMLYPMAADMWNDYRQKKLISNYEAAVEELEEKEYTAAAGGGAVTVTVSGKKEVVSIKLSEEVVDPDDIEMLQDLIVAATNEAFRQMEAANSEAMSKLTGGLGGALGGGFPF